MARLVCPSCGRLYKGLARYCGKCGIELVKDKNRCSEMRTQLCKDGTFDDDDIFCRYCGALTTHGAEQKEAGAILPAATK